MGGELVLDPSLSLLLTHNMGLEIKNNFSEIGADSYTMICAHHTIQSRVGVDFELSVLYHCPTVRLLTEYFHGVRGRRP